MIKDNHGDYKGLFNRQGTGFVQVGVLPPSSAEAEVKHELATIKDTHEDITHFEVHVSHPSRHASQRLVALRGSSEDAFVEEAWARRLRTDYGGGPSPDAPFDLIPAVVDVNTYGG
jgi:hypothetical protein